MPAGVCEQCEGQVQCWVNVCKACVAKNTENGKDVEIELDPSSRDLQA